MSRAVVQAVKVGETMGEEVQVVHVTIDPLEGERFRERVERQLPGARVVLVESPYRALVRPFVRYLEVSQAEDPNRLTWCCSRSTCPATGGIACSTTRTSTASARRSWVARISWSWARLTGAE